jgi:hypothetical protein
MITTASCGLLYGAINVSKTTQLGRAARWLYEKYGFISRLITADNEYDTLKPLIEAGVIEHWAIKALANPFGVLIKLSQGYWPVVRNGKLIMAKTPPEKMARIGAYLVEGTVTIAELCHQNHINHGRVMGEDVVGKFTDVVETDEGPESLILAKSARAHYQQVQDFMTMNLIPTFSMLPIPWVWWSGHEYTGEDEATGQTRLGPGVIGKAAVMKVPRVIGNSFHLVMQENVQNNPQTHKTTRTVERRAYFEHHADSFSKVLMWPAGVKIPAAWIPAWQERFPNGYIPLTLDAGVEQYLEFQYQMAKDEKRLVIAPGTEVFKSISPGTGVQAESVSNSGGMQQPVAPVPAATQATQAATQTTPPRRSGPPVRLPPRVGGSYSSLAKPGPVVVPPTLARNMIQTIAHNTGETPEEVLKRVETVAETVAKLASEPAAIEIPDINAVPAGAKKESDA